LSGSNAGREIATNAVVVGLVDTHTATVTAGNRAYADMVGHAAESLQGLPVEDLLYPPRAVALRAVLAQMREGLLDYVELDVELRGSSGPVHVHAWSQALGGPPPRPKIIAGAVAISPSSDHEHAPSAAADANRIILGTLDHDWRFQDLSTRSASLLGWPLGRGAARLHEIVHPADEAALARVVDKTAIDLGPTTAELRLRGRHADWLDARITVSRLYGEASAPFVSVIGVAAAPKVADPLVDRVNRLEAYLARIAAEVRAAGVLTPRLSVSFIELTELTERQNEILRRLIGGQRVSAIARDLYVSPSTVRNHLSAIYKALGVKSQPELIGLILTQGSTSAGRNKVGDGIS
jgi:DNA-binding CsgD family transcriptional regulator/PAS domain-containing protein